MGKSAYTLKIGDEINSRLALGESLTSICETKHIPAIGTVMGWLLDTRLDKEGNRVLIQEKFSEEYARARLISYQLMADTLLDICDNSRNDYMERENERTGEVDLVIDHENIQRSRLRADKRQWMLAKMLPKIYGDNIHVTKDVNVKGTIEHKVSQGMNFDQVADKRDKLRLVGSSGTGGKK